MLSPFSRLNRKPLVEDRIDRYAALNRLRLFAGLSLSSDFQYSASCLVVTDGRGKHIQVRHTVDRETPLPESLAVDLQRQSQQPTAQLPQVLGDLADFQASEIDHVKRHAGKYVDRILAIGVLDPGIWSMDFDGRCSFQPGCDPMRLAELTGMNIVDNFPSRDLAAGGGGRRLESLPLWLWWADRSPRTAQFSRGFVMVTNEVVGWYLPGSDGLDEILPQIEILVCENGRERPIEHSIIKRMWEFLSQQRSSGLPLDKIVLAGPPNLTEPMASYFENQVPLSMWPQTIGIDACESANMVLATTAAILGAAFVDQMPANVPFLTGAGGQRLLGRVTPGSPAAWRNLLVNMTDSVSPTMALKDAV